MIVTISRRKTRLPFLLTQKKDAMSQKPNVNVGGSNVKHSLSSTQHASVLLQTYTQTILNTPDIKLPADVDKESGSTVVEDLPKHQKQARDNAQFYLDSVNKVLVQRVSDVIGFSNLWNAEYDRLLTLAKDLNSGNNKAVFEQGIQNLIKEAKEKKENTDPAIEALNDFLPKISADKRNITTDEQNVETALGGAKGEIDRLKKQIDADNAAINRDLAIIAGGATADVVGGLMIAVGLLAEIETAGASTALVVGGLAVVGAGTTAMGIAGKNLADTKSDLATKTRELSVAKLSYASTKQANHTIKNMEGALNAGVSAVTSLQKSWSSLQGDFTQVIQELGNADPDLGGWLVNTLQAANTDWADTLKLAKNLQQFGTLPVKKEKAGASAAAA